MKTILSLIAAGFFFSAVVIAQAARTASSSRAAIDAGNQAWIDGVKSGNVALISATYSEDAVNCEPTGECVRGRLQIERNMAIQLAALGQARSATVKTWGSSEHGSFVYEWGQAEAVFKNGKVLVERYLTAWQRQPDGSWKIFRNMVIPDK